VPDLWLLPAAGQSAQALLSRLHLLQLLTLAPVGAAGPAAAVLADWTCQLRGW
jgi:hypothetical protein